MNKKAFNVLLILMVAFTSFVVVTAQDDMMEFECPEGEATVRVALGAVGIEAELGADGVARYMELCPNITVETVEMPNNTNDRLSLYQTFWEAQSADLDVYQVDVIWPGIIAEHSVDLFEYLDQETIDMYFPNMIDGQTIDGKLVALPWFTDAAGLYYRTDLLEKYGVEVPTTWGELTEAAMTIQEGERAEGNDEFWGFVWQGAAYEGLTCDAHEWLVSETGETFISPEGEVNVNNDEFIAAVERAAGWVGTISPPEVTGFNEPATHERYLTGNVAFARNWPYQWTLNEGEESNVVGLNDYAPLPMGAADTAAACLGGWQLAVSQYSANPEAAVSVAKYLASFDEQKIRAIEGSFNPTIPVLYEDEDVLAANELFSRMGPILETAYARPSGITGAAYNDASELFWTAVSNVLTGQTDAASAMDDLELDLEDLLVEIGAVE